MAGALVDRRRIVLNTIANGIAQFASIISSLIFLPLLVRAWDPSNYGLYVLALSVAAYGTLFDFGVGTALTKIVAERLARNEEDSLRGVIVSSTAFFALIGLLVGSAMFACGYYAESIFNVDAQRVGLLRDLLWIGGASQLLNWPMSTAGHVLRGYQRYGITSAISVVSVVAGIGALVAVLVTGQGPLFLTAMNAVILIASSLFTVFVVIRLMRGVPGRRRITLASVRTIVIAGMPIFLIQVAGILMQQHTDRLVLGIFMNASAVTIYETASKLSLFVFQITGLAMSAVLPVVAGLNAVERHESIRSYFLRGAKYTVLLVTPIIVTISILAGPFINNWMGPGFEESTRVAQALLLAQLFVPLCLAGDAILISKEAYGPWIRRSLFIAALNVMLSIVLVQRFGVIGVALGTMIAAFVEFPLYGQMILRVVGLSAKKWLGEAAMPGYPLLILPMAVSAILSRTQLIATLGGIFLIGILSVAVYWVAAYWIALNKRERTEINGAVSLARRRER